MKLSTKVKINIGGEDRDLRLDLNALSAIEEELDVNLMENSEAFFNDVSFGKMRVLIWGMLYAEDPAPSIKDVGIWLSDADLDVVGDALGKAFSMDSSGGSSKTRVKAADPMKG